MAYRVRFTRRGRRDYFRLYESINAPESVPAQEWFRRLDETIALLAVTPRMGTATHEDKTVRQMIYGNKPTSIAFSTTSTMQTVVSIF